jgi:hypothetical protein
MADHEIVGRPLRQRFLHADLRREQDFFCAHAFFWTATDVLPIAVVCPGVVE